MCPVFPTLPIAIFRGCLCQILNHEKRAKGRRFLSEHCLCRDVVGALLGETSHEGSKQGNQHRSYVHSYVYIIARTPGFRNGLFEYFQHQRIEIPRMDCVPLCEGSQIPRMFCFSVFSSFPGPQRLKGHGERICVA